VSSPAERGSRRPRGVGRGRRQVGAPPHPPDTAPHPSDRCHTPCPHPRALAQQHRTARTIVGGMPGTAVDGTRPSRHIRNPSRYGGRARPLADPGHDGGHPHPVRVLLVCVPVCGVLEAECVVVRALPRVGPSLPAGADEPAAVATVTGPGSCQPASHRCRQCCGT
jgi:hypothetical protein